MKNISLKDDGTGKYSMDSVVTDIPTLAFSRVVEQLLSALNEEATRGCILTNYVDNGYVKTNSDIVSLFATSAAQVIITLNSLTNYTINSINLVKFEFVDVKILKLTIRVVVGTSTTTQTVTVTTP
jgi:hypothetical protein